MEVFFENFLIAAKPTQSSSMNAYSICDFDGATLIIKSQEKMKFIKIHYIPYNVPSVYQESPYILK